MKAKLLFEFHDVMAAQALMSDQEVLCMVARFCEADLEHIKEATRVAVGPFLQRQPDPIWTLHRTVRLLVIRPQAQHIVFQRRRP